MQPNITLTSFDWFLRPCFAGEPLNQNLGVEVGLGTNVAEEFGLELHLVGSMLCR